MDDDRYGQVDPAGGAAASASMTGEDGARSRKVVQQDRHRLWAQMPALTEPAEGRPIRPGLAYKVRKSSMNQAKTWNAILVGHPSFDPAACGFVVGVADRSDPFDNGRWPLVWRRAADRR